MKKGDTVIWDNEPGRKARITDIRADGTADIRYPRQGYVITVPVGHLRKP